MRNPTTTATAKAFKARLRSRPRVIHNAAAAAGTAMAPPYCTEVVYPARRPRTMTWLCRCKAIRRYAAHTVTSSQNIIGISTLR